MLSSAMSVCVRAGWVADDSCAKIKAKIFSEQLCVSVVRLLIAFAECIKVYLFISAVCVLELAVTLK